MTLPRPEYPRPQFARQEWINLNGEWSCTLDFSRSGPYREFEKRTSFDRAITVPFCPESRLSGIGYTDFIEMMWYHRKLTIPESWRDKKVLLHFGGVDYISTVYLDGAEVARHVGGFSPFTVDLTGKVAPGREHDLVVKVEDYIRNGLQPFGKQSVEYQSKLCHYTRTTGIWQTVWMEAVSPFALEKCRIVPDFDEGSFSFFPVFRSTTIGNRFTVKLFADGREVTAATVAAHNGAVVTLKIENPVAWEPGNPFLYDVEYLVTDGTGEVVDRVTSYAGLRKIHLEDGKCLLNNRPVFLRFVLDQGFYPEGIWTAPTDADLKRDIELSMQAGFNGARLHQKVFDERFHYWADKLGYLTWAEYSSSGISFWQYKSLGNANPNYNLTFRNFYAEWTTLVERDLNHPSIIGWTPFNETLRPYDLDEHKRFIADIYDITRRIDPTRPVNDTSGYIHVKTDLWTVHVYRSQPEEFSARLHTEPVYSGYPEEEAGAYRGQPYIIDEYGGIKFIPEGRRAFAPNSWGYCVEETPEATVKRIADLTRVILDHPKLVGYCYTQLTDVEQEQNGIYNYDRTPKFDTDAIRRVFAEKPDWSAY